MALSDSCADALHELQTDFVSYADWNYNPVELSRIINAMYELAEFMIRQDLPPDSNLENIEEIIDGAVVATILDIGVTEDVSVICKVLAGVANENLRLSKSINNMLENLTSKENLFDAIKAAKLLEQLKEVKSMMQF